MSDPLNDPIPGDMQGPDVEALHNMIRRWGVKKIVAALTRWLARGRDSIHKSNNGLRESYSRRIGMLDDVLTRWNSA